MIFFILVKSKMVNGIIYFSQVLADLNIVF